MSEDGCPGPLFPGQRPGVFDVDPVMDRGQATTSTESLNVAVGSAVIEDLTT